MTLPQHQFLRIEDIELDRTNPRIQLALRNYGSEITAERIALALAEGSEDKPGAGDTFNKLRNSIRKHKGIVNPIVVNRIKGKLICVEGNTRLQIYRDFKSKEVEGDWSHIPALLYEGANSETTESIRLQAHVIGPRPWTPYAKARYLSRLYDEELLTYDQIVEYCGGNKKEVERSIKAFKLAEEVYLSSLEDPTDFKQEIFSGFVEYQNPPVHDSVYRASYQEKDFCQWLHEGKFDRLEHVRSLPAILKNPKAKEIFLQKGSRAALNYIDQPKLEKILAGTSLLVLLNAVDKKIVRMQYEELQTLKADPSEILDALDATRASIEGLVEDLRDES